MKNFFILLFAFLTFGASGLFTHLCYRTDDLSLRYILWKKGMYAYSSEFIMSLHADGNRNIFVRGKTKEEIKTIFPDAHEYPVNEYQEHYEKRDIKGREHFWIGERHLIIFLEDGIGKELSLMKG